MRAVAPEIRRSLRSSAACRVYFWICRLRWLFKQDS
jgi:hypothetical protein